MRESERAISEANRAIASLEADAVRVRTDARRLGAERARVQQAISRQQAAIERLLRARYAGGAQDPLRVVLSGGDPGEVMRDLYYLERISRASGALIERFRGDLRALEQLRHESELRTARLAEIERAQRIDRERVIAEQRTRQRILASIAEEIRAGRREIRQLRADETRLARLVEEIGRLLAARARSAPPAAPARQAEPLGGAGPFPTLRGRLRAPVQGTLAGRFGAPRSSTALQAKGLFIRAAEGAAVRAVAAGQVVFADWMRGFGNLLILDHGDAYLSIYANNEALLKQVGDTVGPGERIATVGATGGSEESGLYFELRHLGKAIDPTAWVDLN